MSPPWSALLLLIILDEAGSVRPVVTFHPNWDVIFTSESLTMSCDVRSPIPGYTSYVWYKNTRRIHTGLTLVIINAKEGDSGDYQCESATSGRSDPTTLNVKPDTENGWVILQVPLHVHEGDDVTLRCHHYPGYTGGNAKFYKDNVVIRNWGSDPELRINDIDRGQSHRYKCAKRVQHHLAYYSYSVESSITVRELFSIPEIRVTPSPIIEGDHVTMTCHINVSPYRPETTLTFTFLKDGLNVKEFSSSNQYGVQSAHPEDSGKYSCDVTTVSGRTIKKRSNEINVEINAFMQPEIIMTANLTAEGDTMTLTCNTKQSPLIPGTSLLFAFYKDGHNVQEFSLSDQYGVQSTQAEHSGNYTCEVKALFNNLTKRSEKLYIQIQVFTQPEVITTPDITGDTMTLTCHTRRSPLIPDTGLHFAFYKDGHNVQEFSLSDQYRVQSTQAEHSGNYFCEVRALSNNLTKRSEELYIQIEGGDKSDSIFIQNIFRMILSGVILLLCFLFIVYHIRFINSLELVNRKLQRSPEL